MEKVNNENNYNPLVALGNPRSLIYRGDLRVLYHDGDDRISYLTYVRQSWRYDTLFDMVTEAVNIVGDPTACELDDEKHIFYRGVDHKLSYIHYHTSDSKSRADDYWFYQNLGDTLDDLPEMGGNPHTLVREDLVYAFYKSKENDIICLWKQDGNFYFSNLSSVLPQAPSAKGNPQGYLVFGSIYVVYRDINNDISVISYDGKSVNYLNFNYLGLHIPKSVGVPGVSMFGNHLVAAYRDVHNRLSVISFDGASWKYTDLTEIGVNLSLVVGNPFVIVHDQNLYISYMDDHHSISLLKYDGENWTYDILNQLVNRAHPSKGDPFMIEHEGQLHVLYRSIDDHIAQFIYDGEWKYRNPFKMNPRILDVPLVPQQTESWCWAASGEMVMKYYGKDITQAQQASEEFNVKFNPKKAIPDKAVQGGWPDFEKYGFHAQMRENRPLSFYQLKAQLDNGMPVAFAWKAKEGDFGHMMVARGYIEFPQMIYINDPWYENVGNARWLSYRAYVKGNVYEHWRDYYNIFPLDSGMKPLNLSRYDDRPGEAGYEAALDAAMHGLHILPTLASSQTFEQIGLNPNELISDLELGIPFDVHNVGHESLKAYSDRAPKESILMEASEKIYPVLRDGEAITSIVVEKVGEDWFFKSIGDAGHVSSLSAARNKQIAQSGKEESSYYIVNAPSLSRTYLAHDKEDGFTLTHLRDDQHLGNQVHSSHDSHDVFTQLRSIAEKDRFSLGSKNKSSKK